MLSKIVGLIAVVLVLGASYALWKSGVESEAKAELTTEINKQTEKKVQKDEQAVDEIFIDGSDDAVIDAVVSGVLSADAEAHDYDVELWGYCEDTSASPSRVDTGEADVELQDGSVVTQDSEEDTDLAPSVEENDHAINEGVSGEALILTIEEMEAAQLVLGDGCISEMIYLESGLTEAVETCPEKINE